MAEFLCNQLYQHLILMDAAAIYAPVKYIYLPTKTLPSGKATSLHTQLNALGLQPFNTVIKDLPPWSFTTASNMTAPSGYTSISGPLPTAKAPQNKLCWKR